jgi:hypothetical protein
MTVPAKPTGAAILSFENIVDGARRDALRRQQAHREQPKTERRVDNTAETPDGQKRSDVDLENRRRCRDQSSSQLAWLSPNQSPNGDHGTYVPAEAPSTASQPDEKSD